MRLLVVEDDTDLRAMLVRALEEEGHAVDASPDGEDGLWRATTVSYDAIVLDLSLPKMSGLDLLRILREEERNSPVLILTAHDAVPERVEALDLGADDYLVKPFSWPELFARLRAIVRRSHGRAQPRLVHAGVELDPARQLVSVEQTRLELTAKEFQVLHLMMSDPERVFTRAEIIERVWDDDFDASSNIVDVYMSRLRRKLRSSARPLVRSVRGVGYAFIFPSS